jgi:transposase
LDKLRINTTPIAKSLCVEPQKLWRWYRDSLSGFLESEVQEKLHQHDIKLKENGSEKDIRVPILKPQNFGPNMAIDEKQIGEEMHTVLSNRDTGKIAMLAQTLKAKELGLLTTFFEDKAYEVKTITRDLSNSYDWFCRTAFPNAGHIADKFHIIKSLLDACQDVRIRYRQDVLRDKRIKYEQHKQQEEQRKLQYELEGKRFKRKKFRYQERKTGNGETPMELLARSRFLLFKYESQWTMSQRQRAETLFELYPEIEQAYKLCCQFREWYKKENVGVDQTLINLGLNDWYRQVEKIDIDEILNFKSLVERHEPIIKRYFEKGHTNAIAENINGKIKRFIMINQGTRDREFFYFRLGNYFS